MQRVTTRVPSAAQGMQRQSAKAIAPRPSQRTRASAHRNDGQTSESASTKVLGAAFAAGVASIVLVSYKLFMKLVANV